MLFLWVWESLLWLITCRPRRVKTSIQPSTVAADGGWYSDEYGMEQADFLMALRGGGEANQLEVYLRRARLIVALRGRAAAMDVGMPLNFSPDDSTWVVEGRTVRITLGRRLG